MNDMNLFNEKPKKKDELEKEDIIEYAKTGANTIKKVVTPVALNIETREGRATEFLNRISSDNVYKEPLEFLDQAFNLEELLLLQTCISMAGHEMQYTYMDSLNSYKERELNFEARQKMKTLAPNIAIELLYAIRKLEKTLEEYSTFDLFNDVCLVVSYRYMRYYVDCSENTKVELKAIKLGKFSVENNNGSAKINANFSLKVPNLFEYICKINKRTKNYKETKL